MGNAARGVTVWQDIAETLNNIITTSGKQININNKSIWDGFLHRWDNNDWEDMLAAFNEVQQLDPDAVKAYHRNNAENCRLMILKFKHASERVMDKKAHKGQAWAMIMSLREVWNTLHDINIPNEDTASVIKSSARRGKPKTTVETTDEYTRVTIWHNLFELDA